MIEVPSFMAIIIPLSAIFLLIILAIIYIFFIGSLMSNRNNLSDFSVFGIGLLFIIILYGGMAIQNAFLSIPDQDNSLFLIKNENDNSYSVIPKGVYLKENAVIKEIDLTPITYSGTISTLTKNNYTVAVSYNITHTINTDIVTQSMGSYDGVFLVKKLEDIIAKTIVKYDSVSLIENKSEVEKEIFSQIEPFYSMNGLILDKFDFEFVWKVNYKE